ncbi:unnamed protein product [Candidula unifasciata]|uniref:TIR domain-containing protein n=1 Tax=Candidula unifasciata TaxID=100452 RepID=A0A8S4ACJ0_9EUPU|nr:unnamed protein product [Candidula unifasciata]
MLQYIFLAVLATSAAPEVLRYQSSKNVSSRADPNFISKEGQSDKYSFGNLTTEFGSRVSKKIHCKINYSNPSADCSRLGSSDLKLLASLPTNITRLDLSFNDLSFIDNQAFLNFTLLEWLSISHNNLQYLKNGSFLGLLKLTMLDLSSNNLSMNTETYPVGVFKPLKALQRLTIHNNTHINDTDLDYPHEAFADLQNLEYLRLDGLQNKSLGIGFQNMTSLTTLIFRGKDEGHCHFQSLTNETFENVASIRHLEIINCRINGRLLEDGVFVPLPNLTFLDVSHNDALRFENLRKALSAITDISNITTLKMTNIVNPYHPGLCVTNDFAQSLPRKLKMLNASSNSIGTLEMGVLQFMPKTVEQIDVSSNKFAFWRYLQHLDKLESLKVLILGGGDVFDLPRYYPPAYARVYDHCKDEISSTTDEPHFLYGTLSYLTQPLPPKLREVNAIAAEFNNHLSEFHFNETNQLTTINLDSNNFPIVKGPIKGLTFLRRLSMTGCKIHEIYPTFFEFLGSLEFLNMSYNVLGDMALNRNRSLFIHLVNLTVLDLSFNNIWRISPNAFKGLDNLQFLYLQENPILKFNVFISHMHSLIFINFTSTNLVSLPSHVTNELENIKQNSANFTIDFSKNIVHCFCSKISFIKWLTKTRVLANTTRITCTFEDGNKRTVDNLEEVYNNMKKQCASNLEAFSFIITATFVVILAIIGAIVFRFRWKLRYLYYSAILHYKKQTDRANEEEFEYDVFVSYAHEDHYFVENTLYNELQNAGLKVFIHGRHFTAGNFITENIVRAVQTSRRTLVVLTQCLSKSTWSRYEIQMANMEQDHTGRSVLLFLCMEHLPHLPHEIGMYVARNTYIEFPNSQSTEREVSLFWKKLVSDLKSQ